MKYLVKFNIVLLVAILFSCSNDEQEKKPLVHKEEELIVYYPSDDLKELFEVIQLSGQFKDSKTFVDYQPRVSPDSILFLYEKESQSPLFNLKKFVDHWFKAPSKPNVLNDVQGHDDFLSYLNMQWANLERRDVSHKQRYNSLLSLPKPYIVPGGRFREIYYWDSYFTMLGLVESGEIGKVRNMLDNFSYLIKTYGHIPNGNRSYYLSRSQPPFFALMVDLYAEHTNSDSALIFLEPLELEYQYWMSGAGESGRSIRLKNKMILNRYWDDKTTPRPEAFKEDQELAHNLSVSVDQPDSIFYRNIRAAAESGWDFSSRWFDKGVSLKDIETINLVPIDLNCLLYKVEDVLAQMYLLKGDSVNGNAYSIKADKRKEMIITVFWDEEAAFFFDYDLEVDQCNSAKTLAGVFPLFFSIATEQQAEKVKEVLETEFLMDGGLQTTLKTTGQQWDSPNGWAPLQWISIVGLDNYGYDSLPLSIAKRWLMLNKRVFQNTGKMMEKYNVVDTSLVAGGGEYPTQDGFGWTNGVALGLIGKYSLEDFIVK